MLRMKDNGHDVWVIAPFDAYTEKIQTLGIRWAALTLHQTSKNPCKELQTLWHLLRLLKKIQPDMIFTFTIKCNMYVGLIAKIFHIRQIATLAGLGEGFAQKNFFNTLICSLYKIAFKRIQKVFFQNDEDLVTFIRRGIVSEEQSERIPGLGVNLKRFTPHFREERRGTRIFLMFGRILAQKGYGLFLQAAERIKETERASHAEFWILGIQDTSREESLRLFQKILAYHQQKIITYLPATEDVVPILHQVDVVVLPSKYNEGVPSSLLEAMACGKPIITTNWKGCKETVDEGRNGLLVEKGDVESLQKAVMFFLTADDEIIRKMGRASRKKAEREFDEDRIIMKYFAELTL